MAPLRRYLRITKYSVLECRIYLDNPALVGAWLLHPTDPVLPRVLESIRPLVLPKLVEERERARKKGAKNKGVIKDVLVEDDFEVSLFLTETDTRHSLLFKHRKARDKTQTRLVSNSSKLTGASREAPVDVDVVNDDVVVTKPPALLREEDDTADLQTIPAIHEVEGRRKRQRAVREESLFGEEEEDDDDDNDDNDDDDDEDNSSDEPPTKKPRGPNEDNSKKLAMDVVYEGFAIYGRVLCLVIKKRTPVASVAAALATAQPKAGGSQARPAGLAAMENWIASTQAAPEAAEAP